MKWIRVFELTQNGIFLIESIIFYKTKMFEIHTIGILMKKKK